MKNKKRVATSILKILQDGFSKHLFHVRDTKIFAFGFKQHQLPHENSENHQKLK